MRSRLATLAAVSALTLALGASPVAAGSPAQHSSFPAPPMVFDCGSTTLVIVSGTMNYAERAATTASGNWSSTGTLTLSQVLAEDLEGNVYRVVGSAHFGFSYNAQTGVVTNVVDGRAISEGVTTFKFQFLNADGGNAGSLNFLQHGSSNGTYSVLSSGSCSFA
ncbi:MAG: hypothetical protein ABIU97_02525 [Dehalococcoidia bacterium]